MNKLLLASLILLSSCGLNGSVDEDNLDITSLFTSTWNIYEKCTPRSDGSIVYEAVPYGGLEAWVRDHNMPVDWSMYESVRFEFAKPTTTHTQVMISDWVKTTGRPGITSLTCSFDGQDVSQVERVQLQAADSTTIIVKSVRLHLAKGSWTSETIWEGECNFGNWERSITIPAEKFATVMEGDKLEFDFTTDTSDPSREYWQFKTIYNDGKEETLEGNDGDLSQWGTANVAKNSRHYRILLTANDAKRLKKSGLFALGYYTIITRCNVLYRQTSE